jgi:hypothetical protein
LTGKKKTPLQFEKGLFLTARFENAPLEVARSEKRFQTASS